MSSRRALSVFVAFLSVAGAMFAQSSFAQSPEGAAEAIRIRAFNEKGHAIGSAWAAPVGGGYVAPRSLLAGASRAVVEKATGETETVAGVLGEDVEHNLLVVATGIAPSGTMSPAANPIGPSGALRVVCGSLPAYPIREARLRDLPVFGSLLLGSTSHGDAIAGCPVLDGAGGWRGIVVWESPLAKPSLVAVPAEWASTLVSATERSWEEWRGQESATGKRFRDSLLLEGLEGLWRENYPAAIRSLSELIEAHPTGGNGWYYRGYAKAMSGDRPGAIDDYEQAVTHDPGNADAHFSLGFSYLLLKRKLEATEQAKALDAIDAEMALKLRALIAAMSEDEHPAKDHESEETAPPANP